MGTKITLVIDNPADVAAFDAAYPRVLELASQLAGLQRTESAKVWPKEDGTPTPAYRTLDLYFESYESASAAVATEAGGAFFQEVFGLGTPLKALFSDIE